MVCLVCQCLNVTVHCKETSWKARPVPASQLLPERSKERLVVGGETVYEIELDVAGIFTEHKALVLSRAVGDWVIHTCSNCDIDVYISHCLKEEKMFVTGKLKSDHLEIQTAKSNKNFSQVFKIILKEAQDDSLKRKRVSSMTFGREDPIMKLAHAQMKSYLNREQQSMEERIRRYEDEERETFTKLQAKAHSDRSALFAAISKSRENVISDAIHDSMTITTHTYTEPVNTTTFTHSVSPVKRPVVGKVPSPPFVEPRRQVTVTLQDQKEPLQLPKMEDPKMEDPDVDDPDIFSLDGFNEDERLEDPDGVALATGGGVAFPQSDDEDISTDDSSYRDMSALSAAGIAQSVPVGIPMFDGLGITSNEVGRNMPTSLSQEVKKGQFDPDDMGNSIKALALSVQDTGMFGDLPRPRFMMTNPYTRKY